MDGMVNSIIFSVKLHYKIIHIRANYDFFPISCFVIVLQNIEARHIIVLSAFLFNFFLKNCISSFEYVFNSTYNHGIKNEWFCN
jgi:hypothetical protein